MKNFWRNEKGEFTVETVIVFSITFIAIIFVFYIGIIMYEHVHLQSVADRVASRGAIMYATRSTSMDNSERTLNSFWNSDPYRYIYDGGYKATAQAAIQNELDSEMNSGTVEESQGDDYAEANIYIGIINRKVIVEGKKTFDVPFASVFNFDDSFFTLSVKSTSCIMDMPETIRNVDYAADILKRSDTVMKAVEKVNTLKSNLEDFISKIE